MKYFRRSVALVILVFCAACTNPLSSHRSVTLPITDLVVPESASASVPFTVRLTVVSGGCKRFERLVATRRPGELSLEARGRDSSGPNVLCTADIRKDPQTYEVTPPFSNPFTVSAVQPDGSSVTRTVRVQ